MLKSDVEGSCCHITPVNVREASKASKQTQSSTLIHIHATSESENLWLSGVNYTPTVPKACKVELCGCTFTKHFINNNNSSTKSKLL